MFAQAANRARSDAQYIHHLLKFYPQNTLNKKYALTHALVRVHWNHQFLRQVKEEYLSLGDGSLEETILVVLRESKDLRQLYLILIKLPEDPEVGLQPQAEDDQPSAEIKTNAELTSLQEQRLKGYVEHWQKVSGSSWHRAVRTMRTKGVSLTYFVERRYVTMESPLCCSPDVELIYIDFLFRGQVLSRSIFLMKYS